MVDGNLYALIISGSPTDPQVLKAAWENILHEYTEAIGTSEFKLYLSLYKEVSLLEIEYNSIKNAVDILSEIQNYLIQHGPHASILQAQKKWGDELNRLLRTDCKFNNMDSATYQEELNKCIRRSKSIKIKLDLKLLAFAEIQKKNKGGQVMDRRYFDSMLITISDHAKYEIGENITVSKYCERIKRYNHYCESLKSRK